MIFVESGQFAVLNWSGSPRQVDLTGIRDISVQSGSSAETDITKFISKISQLMWILPQNEKWIIWEH